MRHFFPLTVVAALILAAPCLAQTPPPPISQRVTAHIANELGQLRIDVATAQETIADLQASLTAAKARVKELEDKYESRAAPDPAPK